MVMQQEENSLRELEALQKIVPFSPFREIKTRHLFDLNAYYLAETVSDFRKKGAKVRKSRQELRTPSW
jgi:hypothetical protein